MTNVYELFGDVSKKLDNGGEPPDDNDMEKRVKKLEETTEKMLSKINEIERDIAVIKSNYSTKADIESSKNSIIMWVVSAILLAQLLPSIIKKFGL